MKRILASCILAALAAVGVASAADPELKTEDDKIIYALGVFLAQRGQVAAFAFTPAEVELLKAGLSDAALGVPPKVDVQALMPKMQAMAQKRIAASQAATAAAEKKKGKEYLDKIAAKPGIKKLPTGELMDITAEGTGKTPVPTDRVKVNYKGTTMDGHVFDASEKHGGPYETVVNGDIIKCWTDALVYLKPGGKATVYCPPDTAYGDQGRGADIPPGATLIFDLELVEIVQLPPAPK
jgi:FKBP-type peptidyl-prolyl cis-trans isomerase